MNFNKDIRICFISSRSGFIDDDGNLWMDSANGRLINQLLLTYPFMGVSIYRSPLMKRTYDLKINAKKVYALPFPFSYAGGVKNSVAIMRVINKIQSENDILVIQLPFIGFLSLLLVRKPVVYHLCANVLTASSNPVKYKGIRKSVAMTFARFMHVIYRRLFSRAKTKLITNGNELGSLYKKFNPVIAISSSILDAEIENGRKLNGAESMNFRILFVGRPSLEKGFDALIQALMDSPPEFTLTIVGFQPDDFKRMLPEVFEQSKDIHHRLKFKGYLSWDNGLRDILRDTDVIVVPSRSEGTPRVILEGMSQGVAVVASNIGGIPTIVEDGVDGLLINPASASDILSKLMLLWDHPDLKIKLVSAGIEKAKRNTIHNFSKHFIDQIELLKNV